MKGLNKNLNADNIWPLTAAQEGILLGQLLAPDSPMYNAAEVIEINGDLDLALFTQALTQVINAALALHAQYIYTHDASTPAQQKLQPRPWLLHTLDFSDNSHPRAAADAWIKNNVNTLADLTAAIDVKEDGSNNNPIFTQAIFILSPRCILWYQRIHHIACDGYGFALIAKSVATLYEQLRTHTVIPAPIFGDYKKVIEADGRYKKIQEIQKFQSDKNFWCGVMRDIPPPITLQPIAPLQNTQRAVQSVLPATLVTTVKELANIYDSAWTDVLYALCAQWLMFKTGCNYITLGIPLMARMGTPAVRVPAMVMNINPLPINMSACENFEQVILQVTEFQQQARRHQHYRYEQLRRDLIALGSNKRLFGPVVNVMPFKRRLNFGEATSSVQRISAGPVEDLSFSFVLNANDDLVLSLEANPAAYTSEQLQQYSNELLSLMDFYTQNPTAPLKLDLQRLSYAAGAPLNFPFNPVLNEIFVHANNYPTALALIEGDKRLNYMQLITAIEKAAQHIQTAKKTITPCIVAIAASRSSEAIITSLAVLLLGDAYVFIDPKAPAIRNQQIMEDAAPAVVIMAEGGNIQIPENCTALTITQLAMPINTLQPLMLPDISENTLAYVMYTSGSTGKPKGVKIGHGSNT
ncbi:MAG: condensation domain-containing protein [Marinagarivorans sp.]|nr:condensation domain-containing protein [Marinagarivorans sp.]